MKSAPAAGTLEEYWPDIDGLAKRDVVTDEAMPAETFFDLGMIHLLTTATLDSFRALYPEGRFESRRFRPNLVIQTTPDFKGFPENEWDEKILAIGGEVKIKITGPCGRCVMTTLPQGDLPKDTGILKTAAQPQSGARRRLRFRAARRRHPGGRFGADRIQLERRFFCLSL